MNQINILSLSGRLVMERKKKQNKYDVKDSSLYHIKNKSCPSFSSSFS